jgi:outer membrane protein
VLAQPMSIKIEGDGVRADGTPNTLNGKHIATTKLLPPLVIGSYHFGDRRSLVRPYVGLGAMYAVFFGAKTTAFFDEYQGGKTTISTKNTFGAGPFVGLQSSINDQWHVNLSVGQIALRTTSRLVTSNTNIRSGAAVLNDLHPDILEAINVGEELLPPLGTIGDGTAGVTTMLTELVARNRGQANLGTYVREQKMKITNTIVTISVGRSF